MNEWIQCIQSIFIIINNSKKKELPKELSEIDYDLDPTFHVKVYLTNNDTDGQDALPLFELDDGIIEGVLSTRYPEDGEVSIRREEGDGDEYSRYHLLFRSDELIEI